jgi:hypothetical protein
MFRHSSRFLVLVLAVVLLTSGGCGRTESEPAVAEARVTLNHDRVPLGSALEITYEFKVAEAGSFGQDYRVFSHFVDADDELMWTDDHNPPTPTTQWKPGQTIKYTRLQFVPVYPYVGAASLKVGLYGPNGERLPLAGTDAGQRAYRVATMQIAPQTENVYLTFKEGWHLAEMAGENAALEWHWSGKEATLSFRNPRRDIELFLDIDGRTSLLSEPQVVTLAAAGGQIGSFTLGAAREIKRLRISAAQLGQEDAVELKLGVDRTFVPAVVTSGAQRDTRELGIKVFHAFVEAK